MAHYILDKAYKVADVTGVEAYSVVVHGANPGECRLPTAANDGKILGVTVHAQANPNHSVSVRKAGIARVVAAGAIALGAPVNIADTAGRVQALAPHPSGKAQCLGFAETPATASGDIIEVFISLHERAVATA
jgi:hypothetical protein